MGSPLQINRKRERDFEIMLENIDNDEEKQATVRNCGLCIHQPVCSVFMLYKTQVEPATLDPSMVPKAEELAWICRSYLEKKLE